MKINKSTLAFLITQILFLGSILLIIPSFLLTSYPGPQNFSSDNPLPLNQDYSVNFTSPDQSKLSSLKIFLKNPNPNNQNHYQIDLSSNNKLLRSLNVAAYAVADPSWIIFKLENLPVSKNQIFTLSLKSPEKDNGLYIMADKNNQPVYRSFFTYDFLNSFKKTANLRQNQFANNQKFYLLYFFLLISLNFLVFFKTNPKQPS